MKKFIYSTSAFLLIFLIDSTYEIIKTNGTFTTLLGLRVDSSVSQNELSITSFPTFKTLIIYLMFIGVWMIISKFMDNKVA